MSHQVSDFVEITASASDIADIEPNEDVGRVYEIGINGIGLMLADNPEQPDTLPAVIVPSLEPPRLATSDTPFAQAVEQYTFEAFHDWTVGAGQKYLNREGATSRAFWDSEGVDPFTERGELRLLETVSQSLAETYAGLRLVVVGDDMYALTDAAELTQFDGSSWQTPITITNGAPITLITDLASDGQYWYAAHDETGVVRGQATDPAAAWSTEDVVALRWAAGRICAAVKAGSSATPNRFTTLAPDGTEELVGGHLELDAGWTIVPGGVAGGHFFFGAHCGDQGLVYAWQLGVDSEGNFHVPYVAWDMPQGLVPVTIDGAADEVWIRAFRSEGPSAGDVSIYRGVPGSGLTPFLVAELGPTEREGGFVEVDDLLCFSWEDTAGDAALGAVNLATGGYSRWLLGKEAGVVRSVAEYRGFEVFTISGFGVYLQDAATYETAGWLRTSIIDAASGLEKILDEVTLEISPQLAGESVELKYTLDQGATYTSMGTVATAGAQRAAYRPALRTGTFGLEILLGGDGSSRATVAMVMPRFHAVGLRDRLITVRVKCEDNMTGVNGAPLPDNGKGHGSELMRSLLVLGRSRVKFQDVDWHISGVSDVMEVVQVRAERTALYDPSKGERVISGTVELALRKSE